MIECEHFVYGPFPNVGYKLIKSSGVDKLLTAERINYLCRLTPNNKQRVVMAWLKEEDLVSISYIQKTQDDYGRTGVWNHTVLVKVRDFLSMVPPDNFAKHFIQVTPVPPENPLKPLKIG